MNILNYFKKLDWVLLFSPLILVGLGLISLYGSSTYSADFLNFEKQLLFLGIGLLLMVVFSLVDWRFFRDNRYFALTSYLFCLAALIGLLIFAPKIGGSRSWYVFGPFSFAPIEFLKLVLIIVLAKYFSRKHVELYRLRHIFVSGVYVFLPGLLILLEPEMGSVIILSLLWVGILVVSGIKLRHFLLLTFLALVLALFSWSFLLKSYQKDRITSFIFPTAAPLQSGWNQTQAKIAIGSGSFFGKGLGQGTQARYGFLPAAQTDFTFAAIVEETGLAGATVILASFFLLVSRILKIGLDSQNNFSRLFATGLALLIVGQATVNIAMNLGLSPVIGIPLPFISYGGSSLVLMFLSLGIIQNIKMNS